MKDFDQLQIWAHGFDKIEGVIIKVPTKHKKILDEIDVVFVPSK